ncbi:hypothetical protein BN2476_680099 [Paraburkholderia piptadeniae]|uniref:Uncharacterized protein n=1 Tax=Paraburkholderia piptadeniae TaxID=1701573 RepID=A0A1N7SPK1_9BURK|nr:hypothetical protein BN2476_680099 [Paraburkholderia piptadeniae]
MQRQRAAAIGNLLREAQVSRGPSGLALANLSRTGGTDQPRRGTDGRARSVLTSVKAQAISPSASGHTAVGRRFIAAPPSSEMMAAMLRDFQKGDNRQMFKHAFPTGKA